MQTIIGSIGRQTQQSFNQIATLITFAYKILRLITFPPKTGNGHGSSQYT